MKKIDLMVVGAHKAGSTSLFRYIVKHPQINTQKQNEFGFFLRDHEFEKGYENAFHHYFGHNDNLTNPLLAKFALAMYDERAIQRMYEHNPNMYLPIIVRNPIDRAYSSYWFARRTGWERCKTFEEGLAEEDRRLAESWYDHRDVAYVFNGLYYEHIQMIQKYFSPNRILLYTLEKVKANPEEVFREIYDKIGVSTDFVPNTNKIHNPGKQVRSETTARITARIFRSRNIIKVQSRKLIPDFIAYKLRRMYLDLNEKDFIPPPMSKSTREMLAEKFKPFNDNLGKLMGVDLSHWNK